MTVQSLKKFWPLLMNSEWPDGSCPIDNLSKNSFHTVLCETQILMCKRNIYIYILLLSNTYLIYVPWLLRINNVSLLYS